jgi:hypothetical protein
MFIEVSRSVWRTPAGCNVGYALLLRELIPAHCTPLGCGSRTGHVSINIAPLRGDTQTDGCATFSARRGRRASTGSLW